MMATNLLQIYTNTRSASEIMLSRSCENQAAALNNQISLIVQSVDNLYGISERFRPSLDELKNKDVEEAYISQILDTAITIAENTTGAVAIYYRLNPDVTLSGTSGFFCVKDMEKDEFFVEESTDLLAYEVNDVEHVGWYYEPVWTGKPVWMEPYYNANIGVEMISYVRPVYDGPYLVGVIGMDVDFNLLKEVAEDNQVYQSGGAVLCSMTNSRVYHNRSSIFGDSIPNDIYTVFQGSESAGKILEYSIKSKNYCLYYVTLGNRMKYMIYADRSEVFSQTIESIITNIVIFSLVFLITLLLSLKMGKKISAPIDRITEATKQYAAGNWDVKIACDTQDELQILAENVTIMAEKTKEYIDYIEELAKNVRHSPSMTTLTGS